MFDEISAKAVIANKKVFQASVDRVCLGNSQTNVNMLSLWLWKIRMVVASNCWAADLQVAPTADSAWLASNSEPVYVHEPLWIADDAGGASDMDDVDEGGAQECLSPCPCSPVSALGRGGSPRTGGMMAQDSSLVEVAIAAHGHR